MACRSRLLTSLVLGAALLVGSFARADDERVPEAQRHFEAGMASFNLEEYDKAIAEWEAGYRLKPAPQFLYNIAQAYRVSRRPEKALAFYQKYLRLEPKAANRPEVERHIEVLKPLVEQQQLAAERPSTQPMSMRPGEPAPTAAPAARPEPARADVVASAPERKRPVYKKPWFWAVVGVGAVVVAGAVTLGVVLGTSSGNEQLLPVARF
jgi:tetratricopeptide (TPR) repeat protein